MTQQQRSTYWQELVEAQSQSGLDVTTFCRDRRINRQRFYLWRQRFQKPGAEPEAFLELVPSSRSGESGVRLHLNQSLSIELDRGFDPATLQQVLTALRAKGPCLP
jgi:hypothetical protein